MKKILLITVVAFITACSTLPMKSEPKWIGYKEFGKASFYSLKYQFRKTASGERFNQLAKTAAHKTLPLGSKVKVTNIKNGKSVIVKINDRGPYVKGRIIDLTWFAFNAIASTSSGVIDVSIEVIK
jgi:peptidoglycan lytic transglycosylase